MTDQIKPATDEQAIRWRSWLREGGDISTTEVFSLIARIEIDRTIIDHNAQVAAKADERARKAEALLAQARFKNHRLIVDLVGPEKTRVSELEAQVEVLNGAIECPKDYVCIAKRVDKARLDRVKELEAQLAQKDKEIERIKAASLKLVDDLQACHEGIQNAFVFAAIHGARYNGPEYGTSLADLKTLLGRANR